MSNRVVVIGGGIVGVTTAFFLQRAGCQVTLIERRSGVAQECSFGNAGVVAPGYVGPWAAPGMPGKVLGMAFQPHRPVRWHLRASAEHWSWLRAWWRACSAERYSVNRARMQRLALYSRDLLLQTGKALELDYELRTGYLQLLRTPKAFAQAQAHTAQLAELGIRHRLMDAEQVREHEPSLNPDTPLAGALHLPDDFTGNCALFARLMRSHAQSLGCELRFGEAVEAIETSDSGVSGLRLRDVLGQVKRLDCEHVVVAGGLGSTALLRPLGLRVPLLGVRGYSATLLIHAPEHAPRESVMDEHFKVAITRMGNRLRVAGTAEIGARGERHNRAALDTLHQVLKDWFPAAARSSTATYWHGDRPMLPDGAPLLGDTPVTGLWLNLGHGSSGWAMACGSAQITADLICGKSPAIDLDGLRWARYQ
ncbi:MAG TPA: D-amino acid dehydrogenase [Burkholderiaceae bacterium]|nr:D-amino acid dehydrogenase [Burkholderiaceae bacterium]